MIKKNKTFRLSFLHPFSAQSIGLNEKDLHYLHSLPQVLALKQVEKKVNLKVTIDYFSARLLPFTGTFNSSLKRFWPITKPIKNRHKWRKQFSLWHYFNQLIFPSHLTYINMSGHGSPYVFKLARLIKMQGNYYVSMIGGVNVTTTGEALHYYKNAHHIIVHTEMQKNELIKIKAFSNLDIRVMPLGVDVNKFKPLGTNLKEGYFNLLQVGRITRLKQIELSIQTLKFLKDKGVNAKLNIIGFYSDIGYLKELNELVFTLNLANEVQFIGGVNHEDLIRYYQHSNLLLMPSKHESFGMVMIEAMSCGVPVIALKGAIGPDEIVEDGVNGFLCSKTTYSEKVHEILIKPNLMREMSLNARATSVLKYDLNKTYEVFVKSIDAIKRDL